MSENVTNELLQSVLQKMQAHMLEMKLDVRDLKMCKTMAEEHLGGSLIATSGVNSRLDRLNDCVERIENRLDLTVAR